MGHQTTTLWWLWAKLFGNIPGHMRKQYLPWGCTAMFFSKWFRVGNYVPSCSFLLVLCFPWYFPQLLADTVSSFYMWKLRHRSSHLYLDVWLSLSRTSCLWSRLCLQHLAPAMGRLFYNPEKTPVLPFFCLLSKDQLIIWLIFVKGN